LSKHVKRKQCIEQGKKQQVYSHSAKQQATGTLN